ncbi:unnamed protein product [Vitrella brassicaformis CCMP3155]|uniref:Uncharacterized protein n=2 Tax=Vitrella brassicaformis TaxID=1169539 RepID=A0A0G4GHC8_VITBC|nr:unnamed protein product [Vitrella brassicaformis CCMP3155]|eukprot:CEM29135.1 unnamed protein product [Vitrella brassicaformis CCMP3155]
MFQMFGAKGADKGASPGKVRSEKVLPANFEAPKIRLGASGKAGGGIPKLPPAAARRQSQPTSVEQGLLRPASVEPQGASPSTSRSEAPSPSVPPSFHAPSQPTAQGSLSQRLREGGLKMNRATTLTALGASPLSVSGGAEDAAVRLQPKAVPSIQTSGVKQEGRGVVIKSPRTFSLVRPGEAPVVASPASHYSSSTDPRRSSAYDSTTRSEAERRVSSFYWAPGARQTSPTALQHFQEPSFQLPGAPQDMRGTAPPRMGSFPAMAPVMGMPHGGSPSGVQAVGVTAVGSLSPLGATMMSTQGFPMAAMPYDARRVSIGQMTVTPDRIISQLEEEIRRKSEVIVDLQESLRRYTFARTQSSMGAEEPSPSMRKDHRLNRSQQMKYEQEWDDMVEEITALRTELERARNELDRSKQVTARTETHWQGQMEGLKKEIETAKVREEMLQRECRKLKEEMTTQRQSIDRQASMGIASTLPKPVKVEMPKETPRDAKARLERALEDNAALQSRLLDFERQVAKLEDERRHLDKEKNELKDLLDAARSLTHRGVSVTSTAGHVPHGIAESKSVSQSASQTPYATLIPRDLSLTAELETARRGSQSQATDRGRSPHQSFLSTGSAADAALEATTPKRVSITVPDVARAETGSPSRRADAGEQGVTPRDLKLFFLSVASSVFGRDLEEGELEGGEDAGGAKKVTPKPSKPAVPRLDFAKIQPRPETHESVLRRVREHATPSALGSRRKAPHTTRHARPLLVGQDTARSLASTLPLLFRDRLRSLSMGTMEGAEEDTSSRAYTSRQHSELTNISSPRLNEQLYVLEALHAKLDDMREAEEVIIRKEGVAGMAGMAGEEGRPLTFAETLRQLLAENESLKNRLEQLSRKKRPSISVPPEPRKPEPEEKPERPAVPYDAEKRLLRRQVELLLEEMGELKAQTDRSRPRTFFVPRSQGPMPAAFATPPPPATTSIPPLPMLPHAQSPLRPLMRPLPSPERYERHSCQRVCCPREPHKAVVMLPPRFASPLTARLAAPQHQPLPQQGEQHEVERSRASKCCGRQSSRARQGKWDNTVRRGSEGVVRERWVGDLKRVRRSSCGWK